MVDQPSNKLSREDRDELSRFLDVNFPEPEQLNPPYLVIPEDETPPTIKRLNEIHDRAQEVNDKILELKGRVDERCSRFKVSGPLKKGSRLYQAMWRIFGERTNTVTYSHYKRALEMRQKLVELDVETLRKT